MQGHLRHLSLINHGSPVHPPSEYQIIVHFAVPPFTMLFRYLLLGSDKGTLYYWGPTKDSFTIGVRQRNPLLLGSDKGFLYYWGLTKDSFTIGVRQRIPLLLGSDKGFFYYWGLTKDSFTSEVPLSGPLSGPTFWGQKVGPLSGPLSRPSDHLAVPLLGPKRWDH